MLRREHQAQRPRLQGHAAAENRARGTPECWSFLGSAEGSTITGPLAAPAGCRGEFGCPSRPFRSAGFPAGSRRADWSFRFAKGRGRRRRTDRPFECPAAGCLAISTSETLPEPAASWVGHVAGLHLFEQRVALRRGAGSLPVPCRPVTRPTASTRTGCRPVGHGQIADQPGVVGSSARAPPGFATASSARPNHEQPPRTIATAQQKTMKTFHASLHSVSIEKSRRREPLDRHRAGRLRSHSDANDSDSAAGGSRGRMGRRQGRMDRGRAECGICDNARNAACNELTAVALRRIVCRRDSRDGSGRSARCRGNAPRIAPYFRTDSMK